MQRKTAKPGKTPVMTAPEVEAFLSEIAPSLKDQHWVIRVEALEQRNARVRLTFDERHTRPGGTIMGAAQFQLADVGAYVVILGALGRAGANAVTSNLNITYLRRPGACDLIGKTHLIKLGRRLAVCSVELYSDGDLSEDAMVAHAIATYAMP